MLQVFRYFSCHIDDLSWWFAILTPEVCKIPTRLCAWRQIKTLIWSMESLPLSYSLSSICSCSLQGILNHRADCWPLHRGNSETAGHPSQGQTDVQVTWRGTEWGKERREKEGERWCGKNGSGGMIEAGEKKELKHWCKDLETSLAIPCQPQRWAKYFPLSLGRRSSFVSHIDSPTSLL